MTAKFVICFLAAAWLSGDLATASAQQIWPRFLGADYSGDAIDPPHAEVLATKPSVRWVLEVGDGYGLGVFSKDRYFHFDSVIGEDGERRQRLRATDRDSGAVKWTVDEPLGYSDMYGYESGPRTAPTLASSKQGGPLDRILTMGVDGRLTCRSISRGEAIWSVDTRSKFSVVQNFFGVGGSPLVWNDQVIVMVGGSPAEDLQVPPGALNRVSPNRSLLVSFGLADGKERWRCGEDLASYSSPRMVTIDGKPYVALLARDHFWLIDPVHGVAVDQIKHRASILESVNAMMPVVDSGRIFISECYGVGSKLLRLQNEKLDVIWQDPERGRTRAMRSHWSAPVKIGDYLYGCSGRNPVDCDFRCIEFATGKVLWEALPRRRSSVTRLGDHYLIWDERGEATVAKANPDRLEVIQKFRVGDLSVSKAAKIDRAIRLRPPCWAAPVMLGKQLYLRGDKQVVRLDF